MTIMIDKLFRSLNEQEQIGRKYNSSCSSPRKRAVKKFYEQINNVCDLSITTGIKIATALRIATQYGWVIEDIQRLLNAGMTEIPLSLFLVYDESEKPSIPMDKFVNFFQKYNGYFQDFNVFLDEEKGDGQYFWEVIWERVRRLEFPNCFSRLDCTFAFADKSCAITFAKEVRGPSADIVEVELIDATMQKYDMQWVSEVPENCTMKDAMEYARCYWRGEKTQHPVIECLISGDYKYISGREDDGK